MGKKKMPTEEGRAKWNEGYYKTPLKSTDWQSAINKDWKTYQPEQVASSYQPLQGNVMSRLASTIQSGGYSPEQKQAMYKGAMTPVQEEAQKMREQAEADAYRRGLGQSGVLSRSYGDIDRDVLARSAEISGGIEGQSAQNAVQNALQAIQQYQTGTQTDRDYQLQYDTLRSQINLDDRQMQLMLGQLQQAAYKDDYTRELQEMQIMNQFGLDKAQVEIARWLAEQSTRTKITDVLGTIFGR